MTSTSTWTTLAKACLLLFYMDSVQYVTSQTAAIPLKDVGVAEDTKLPLTTSPTHTSPLTTHFLDSNTVSTGMDLQPSPTHLPEFTSSLVIVSKPNSRDVTPQLTSQDFSKLSPFEATHDYSMNLLNNFERTSVFSYDSLLSNSIFATTSSSIVEELSSTLYTSTFPTKFSSTTLPSTTNVDITNTTFSSLTALSNISSNSPAITSPLGSVNTSLSTSSTLKPRVTTLPGRLNVTVTLTTTPKGTSTIKLGEGDRFHKGPDENQLSTPAIIGIGFGAAAFVLILIGVGLLVMKKKVYRRNKHDPSNFWDDNVTLSYINSHADFPKDFDAEMMSLDDDSFLNSLDSVTFANIWATDTAKHTNF